MTPIRLISAAAFALISASVMAASTTSEDTPGAAIAVMHGTAGHADITGTVHFMPTADGLAYTANAHGLPPGMHGYHIHLYGDCSSADGKSAGTHFNLKGSSLHPPKDIKRITGNLVGNLDADASGDATAKGTLKGASLTGAKAIIGHSVIIHEKANDPSQPPIGAAGSRLACGVIGMAEAGAKQEGG